MENVSAKSTVIANEAGTSYTGPLAILTTLFFMWGSLTSLNDVLIPYAQHVFKIELAASMLIQTAFFSAYFIFSIPAAKIIDWIGYKRAIVVGLLTMVVACLGFFPAAKIPSFPFFLAALGYEAFGDIHGADEVQVLEELPDRLRAQRIDAMVAGVGA